jgi:hypothetical protein
LTALLSAILLLVTGCSSTAVHIYQRDIGTKSTFSFTQNALDPNLGVEVERIIQVMEAKGYTYAPGNGTGIVISLNYRETNNPRGQWSNLQRSLSASVAGKPIVTASSDEDWAHLFKSYDTARETVLTRLCDALEKGVPPCKDPAIAKPNGESQSATPAKSAAEAKP